MKCVTTKYGKKILIIIDFNGEIFDLFAPKRFDSKAADLKKKLKKLDRDMILMVVERKEKYNINY